MEHNQGEFSHHTNCDECGSSDGRAVYDNGSSYCFACQTWSATEDYKHQTSPMVHKGLAMIQNEYQQLNTRKIPEAICKQYKKIR